MLFNKMIPELSVSNLSQSLQFYVSILGFNIEYDRIESGFAFISLNGAQIMLEQDNDVWVTGKMEYPRGRGINFQIEVDDLDSVYERIKSAGIDLFRDKAEKWRRATSIEFGEVEFLVKDPDGYLLRFSQSIGERIANIEQMNN